MFLDLDRQNPLYPRISTLLDVTSMMGAYLLVLDEAGNVLGMNSVTHRDLRFDSENSPFGLRFSDIISSEAIAPDDAGIARLVALGSGSGERCRGVCERADGTAFPIDFAANSMPMEGRTLAFVLFRDVTNIVREEEERVRRIELLDQQQKELAESRRALKTLTNSIKHGLISFDESGKIITFNLEAERLFQYSIKDILGVSFFDLLAPKFAMQYEKDLEHFLTHGESAFLGRFQEIIGRRRDASEFPMEIAVSWMEMGTELAFSATVRDISARKEAEEERARLERELSHAQKMESLGVLAGGIAHEINTPIQYVGDNLQFLETARADLAPLIRGLSAIATGENTDAENGVSMTDLLALAKESDLEFYIEEVSSAISQGVEGVKRVREIVQAIKEFSHPDTQDSMQADINHLIETTILVARNQWKYVADLETNLDTTLPQITCFPGALNQVFLNLIVNAAHAIEERFEGAKKGRIEISTLSAKDGQVVVEVKDNGCGIASGDIKKIFDPFYTTKAPGLGTGQGLSITHFIVTSRHKGTISVQSTPGEGTVFSVCLPVNCALDPNGDALENDQTIADCNTQH